jgi:hypothetical protein
MYNSPSNKSRRVSLTRLSVQSYVEISLFPLDETLIPSPVNNPFRNYRVRDK